MILQCSRVGKSDKKSVKIWFIKSPQFWKNAKLITTKVGDQKAI
jgi:hypothetical protein